MKLTLNVEEDESLRKTVHDLIEGQVRHILREQLSGIVGAEIAKLRILQPDSPALTAAVTQELHKVLHKNYGVTQSNVRTEITKQVSELLAPEALSIKDKMRASANDMLKNLQLK